MPVHFDALDSLDLTNGRSCSFKWPLGWSWL